MATKDKTYKIPATLGACADKMAELDAARAKLGKEDAELKAHYLAIEAHLVDSLPLAKAEGIMGKVAHAVVKRKRIPTLKDWQKFTAHVLKTKDFSLLQHRISTTAVEEQWEAKKTVPGVEGFNRTYISLTKAK
jgi:hypothetical protein